MASICTLRKNYIYSVNTWIKNYSTCTNLWGKYIYCLFVNSVWHITIWYPTKMNVFETMKYKNEILKDGENTVHSTKWWKFWYGQNPICLIHIGLGVAAVLVSAVMSLHYGTTTMWAMYFLVQPLPSIRNNCNNTEGKTLWMLWKTTIGMQGFTYSVQVHVVTL